MNIYDSLQPSRAFIKALEDASRLTSMQSLVNATKSPIITSISIANASISKMVAEHSAIQNALGSTAALKMQNIYFSETKAAQLMAKSFDSQRRLLNLEANSIGRLLRMHGDSARELTSNLEKITHSYRTVIESAQRFHSPLSKFSIENTPREYSFELDVLEKISVDVDGDANANCSLPTLDDAFTAFDADFLIPLQGARDSFVSNNPDKARHITASLRESFGHMIRRLAPDTEVKKWSTDPSHLANGKWTRKSRLLYICRDICGDPLEEFVDQDVNSALVLVDSLNAGTHVIQSMLSDSQLRALILRMEALLLFLLRISKGC